MFSVVRAHHRFSLRKLFDESRQTLETYADEWTIVVCMILPHVYIVSIVLDTVNKRMC